MGEQRESKAEIILLYENSGAFLPLEAQGDIPATGPLQFIAKAKRLRACLHHLPEIIKRHQGAWRCGFTVVELSLQGVAKHEDDLQEKGYTDQGREAWWSCGSEDRH